MGLNFLAPKCKVSGTIWEPDCGETRSQRCAMTDRFHCHRVLICSILIKGNKRPFMELSLLSGKHGHDRCWFIFVINAADDAATELSESRRMDLLWENEWKFGEQGNSNMRSGLKISKRGFWQSDANWSAVLWLNQRFSCRKFRAVSHTHRMSDRKLCLKNNFEIQQIAFMATTMRGKKN